MTEYRKRYLQEHRDEICARQRRYNRKHRKEIREACRRWTRQNRDKTIANTKRWNQSPKGKFYEYQKGAKARGISFTLTLEEFMLFWQKPCIVGCFIKTVGLDRIDSNKGYVIGNIRSMCRRHNFMKNVATDRELIELAEALKLSKQKKLESLCG